jgi:hypothetical protein
MPNTRTERDALLADLLRAIPLDLRDAITAATAEDAVAAMHCLADHYDALMCVATVEVAAQHTAAALARADHVSRQAMHERISRARADLAEMTEQYEAQP